MLMCLNDANEQICESELNFQGDNKVSDVSLLDSRLVWKMLKAKKSILSMSESTIQDRKKVGD